MKVYLFKRNPRHIDCDEIESMVIIAHDLDDAVGLVLEEDWNLVRKHRQKDSLELLRNAMQQLTDDDMNVQVSDDDTRMIYVSELELDNRYEGYVISRSAKYYN